MWTSKGRSGYSDSTIGGDYDSWDGVTPNGKQYKNESTMETRNLSGADYWHLRKQNRPTESIPAHLHMLNKDRANIEAYKDPTDGVKRRKTSVPLRQRILPQEVRLNTLDTQIEELNQEYNSNRMSYDEYVQLKTILDKKRTRAWQLYVKAGGVVQESMEEDDLPIESAHEINDSHSANSVCGVGIIDDLSDENCLKVFLQKACKGYKLAVQFGHKAKSYWNELKEV